MRFRAKTPLRIRKRVGHAESLRLCGAMLGACVGMTTRHHAKMEEGGRNREVGSGHTSISLDGLGGECERKHSDA